MLLALLPACSFAGDYHLVVTTDANTPDSARVQLVSQIDGSNLGDAIVLGHSATIQGKCDAPQLAYLIVGRDRCLIVVEEGTVRVDLGPMRRLFPGMAHGTPANDLIREFYDTRISPVDREVSQLGVSVRDGKISPEVGEARYDSLRTVQSEAMAQFCLDHIDGLAGRWAFCQYVEGYRGNYARLKAFADALPASYAAAPPLQSRLTTLHSLEATQPGCMYVDFEATQPDGTVKRLSQYVGHGHVVLLDFWASWCVPCRREMPNIRNIYDKYRDKGLEVVSVAVFDEEPNTLKALEQLQLTWEQMINGGKAPALAYGVTAIPHVVIFDGDGRIIARGLHGEELSAKMDEIMGAQ